MSYVDRAHNHADPAAGLHDTPHFAERDVGVAFLQRTL